jgi:hypothetical protein
MMGFGTSASIQVMATKLRNRQTAALLLFFLLAPVLAPVAGVVKPLNIVALWVMFLLFAGCVLLIPVDELPTFYRFTLWVFLFGFLLNTWYELLHSVFYIHFTEPGYTYPELVLMLVGSAVADGFISLNLLFAVTVFRRGKWDWASPWSWNWRNVLFVVVVALGMQVIGETVALNTGQWAYNAAMPLLPGLGIGLTPALQMPLLILPTFWLAQRMVCLPVTENPLFHTRQTAESETGQIPLGAERRMLYNESTINETGDQR